MSTAGPGGVFAGDAAAWRPPAASLRPQTAGWLVGAPPSLLCCTFVSLRRHVQCVCGVWLDRKSQVWVPSVSPQKPPFRHCFTVWEGCPSAWSEFTVTAPEPFELVRKQRMGVPRV